MDHGYKLVKRCRCCRTCCVCWSLQHRPAGDQLLAAADSRQLQLTAGPANSWPRHRTWVTWARRSDA